MHGRQRTNVRTTTHNVHEFSLIRYLDDSTNHGEQYNSQRPTGLHNGSTGAMHEPLNGSEQNMPPPAPTQTLSTGQQSEPERQTTLVPPNPYAGPSQPAPSVGPSRPGFIEIPTWSYSRIQSHEIRIKYGDLSVLNRYQFDEYQAFRAWRAEFTGWDPTTRGPFPYHPPQEMVNGRQHIQEDLLPRADMFQFGNGVPGMPMPPPTLPPGWQVNYHGNGSIYYSHPATRGYSNSHPGLM